MKTEFSLECIICGVYNIQEGFILNGEIICWSCIKQPDFKKILKRMKK